MMRERGGGDAGSVGGKHRMPRRLGVASFILALLAWGGAASGTAQPSARVFPLRVQVARAEDGGAAPVVDDAWLSEQIAQANTIFGPHGVGFVVDARHPLPDAHARMETRADRHALGARLDPTRLDVFVVRSLRDVDEPSVMRRGVHWRPAGRPGAHFVIVSAISGPTVLAHELGHYFGNPHSETPGNVMSYERADVPPFFDAGQARRIARFARRFEREGAPRTTSRAASAMLPAEAPLPR